MWHHLYEQDVLPNVFNTVSIFSVGCVVIPRYVIYVLLSSPHPLIRIAVQRKFKSLFQIASISSPSTQRDIAFPMPYTLRHEIYVSSKLPPVHCTALIHRFHILDALLYIRLGISTQYSYSVPALQK